MDILPASFRDPDGFLFTDNGMLYRQINHSYKGHFLAAEEQGLWDELIDKKWLIPHMRVDHPGFQPDICFQVIAPEKVPFVSYPYEWSFSQLKDAALLTLDIQEYLLDRGFTLKDASAYNIQFVGARPVFIDTLSLSKYDEGQPWVGYRQFCQHFLAPLALMSKVDLSLNRLLQLHLDGVPLDLAQSILRGKSWRSFGLFMHIKLHARSQKKYQSTTSVKRQIKRYQLKGILDNLRSCISKMNLPKAQTEWGDYYDHTNYTDESFRIKEELIRKHVQHCNPESVWDLGANDGTFSRIADNGERNIVSFDIDALAVEKHYCGLKKDNSTTKRLPLIMDLTNPSPGIGWHSNERSMLLERGPVDMCFALALIHHLAISNNLSLDKIAAFFADCANTLVIEFVPKEDSQVQTLLATREDIFDTYDIEHFEKAFKRYFRCIESNLIKGSVRTLYYFEKL